MTGTESKTGYRHRATLRDVSRGSGEGNERIILAKRVIITTGLHVTPNIPSIPGLTSSPTSNSPQWIHSSSYKSRSQVKGKKVLVLGCGETGMDVAYESVLANAAKVWMGVRSGFLSFPKVLNNFRVLGSTFDGALPIDGLITNLFETAYVHPWVAASHLRWFVSDFVIKRVLYVLTGTQAGCNQWAGELPPERQGRAYVFLNKSAKAMQFINRPYEGLSWVHRLIAHYIDPPLPKGIEDPTIYLTTFPKEFDAGGKAVFPPPPKHRQKETEWKKECKPDLVVLCTGYKQDWGWMGEGYVRPDQLNVRGVCHDTDLSVGYIGFLRPGVGESTRVRSEREEDIIDGRRNPSHGRDASATLPTPLHWSNTHTHFSRNIPPPAFTHRSDPVWGGLLDVYGHFSKRHWVRPIAYKASARPRSVRDFHLLVCWTLEQYHQKRSDVAASERPSPHSTD